MIIIIIIVVVYSSSSIIYSKIHIYSQCHIALSSLALHLSHCFSCEEWARGDRLLSELGGIISSYSLEKEIKEWRIIGIGQQR